MSLRYFPQEIPYMPKTLLKVLPLTGTAYDEKRIKTGNKIPRIIFSSPLPFHNESADSILCTIVYPYEVKRKRSHFLPPFGTFLCCLKVPAFSLPFFGR